MCRRVLFEVIDVEEEERYCREVIRRVGRPPQEGHAQGDTPTWYSYFVEAAAEQYQESLTKARAFYMRNLAKASPFAEEEQESFIADQATAFRTLAVRDTMLYVEFARDGVVPPLAGPVCAPLNAEQLDALFRELQRRGAFAAELHPFAHYENLTDHEMWLLHREEGESYCTWDGGYWSLLLW